MGNKRLNLPLLLLFVGDSGKKRYVKERQILFPKH